MARILVVDDDRNAVDVYSQCLKRMGHEVQAAADGLQATALASQFKPDLAILDFQMPAGEGDEVLRRIRSFAHGTLIPIILLSALPVSEQKKRIPDDRGIRFLQKPIPIPQLQEIVASLLGGA